MIRSSKEERIESTSVNQLRNLILYWGYVIEVTHSSIVLPVSPNSEVEPSDKTQSFTSSQMTLQHIQTEEYEVLSNMKPAEDERVLLSLLLWQHLFVCFSFLVEIGFLCGALAILELALYTRLIQGMCHLHTATNILRKGLF